MFISDHETEIDLLYYDSIAKTIIKLILESPDMPLTIGIHGDWGAGKSSILAMTEKTLKIDKDIIYIRFNGWQFQGFEDAKAALIETIITELSDARNDIDKFKEKAINLLKRVDYLKIAKKGINWAFSLATGIPHPEQINDAMSLLKGIFTTSQQDITPDKIKETILQANDFLKPGEEKKIPEQMRAFQQEFNELLEIAKLKKLVVLIDDLDRCLPQTAIETLEAIRLFLFAPKTVFIIASDEAMIEYAVKQHFPELPVSTGPNSYARNYLEKLIQIPFRIPALGYAETQIYISLMLIQAELGNENNYFQILLSKARENLCKPWNCTTIDFKTVQDCLQFTDINEIPKEIKQAITLSNMISKMLTDGTKGNPRQIKRFLNSLLLRHKIAEARGFGGEISLPILAKIMLAESYAPLQLYDKLTKATYSSNDGKPQEIIILENSILPQEPKPKQSQSKKQDIIEEINNWTKDEWIINWVQIAPSLRDIDLRPYMFLTREKRSYFGGISNSSHLDYVVEALMGRTLAIKTIEPQLQKLSHQEVDQIYDLIQMKIIQADNFINRPEGLISLTTIHPHLQKRLFEFIKEIPLPKLGTWIITGFDNVFTDPTINKEYQIFCENLTQQDENPKLKAAVQAFKGNRGRI